MAPHASLASSTFDSKASISVSKSSVSIKKTSPKPTQKSPKSIQNSSKQVKAADLVQKLEEMLEMIKIKTLSGNSKTVQKAVQILLAEVEKTQKLLEIELKK
uniref:Uncharacterized protein n=1 Tax=Panagrolaimus sp. JU765 TaxID=591449 RepID=A0AC34R7P0_9BILA